MKEMKNISDDGKKHDGMTLALEAWSAPCVGRGIRCHITAISSFCDRIGMGNSATFSA